MPDREAIAAVQHEIWAHWMRYLFRCCEWDGDAAVIPAGLVDRWQRQIDTAYADLSEHEKDSDRAQADKVLEVFRAKAQEKCAALAEATADATPVVHLRHPCYGTDVYVVYGADALRLARGQGYITVSEALAEARREGVIFGRKSERIRQIAPLAEMMGVDELPDDEGILLWFLGQLKQKVAEARTAAMEEAVHIEPHPKHYDLDPQAHTDHRFLLGFKEGYQLGWADLQRAIRNLRADEEAKGE